MNKQSSTAFFKQEDEKQKANVCFFTMGQPTESAPIRYTDIDVASRIQRHSPISTVLEIDVNQTILEEEILSYETWQGRVLSVSDNFLQMEVRNDKFRDVKRTLRVHRMVVVNSDCAYVGAQVHVAFKKVRKYSGHIQNTTTIELHRIVDIPEEIKERRYTESMNRYSYMFEDEE